jgi:hypothetical protein
VNRVNSVFECGEGVCRAGLAIGLLSLNSLSEILSYLIIAFFVVGLEKPVGSPHEPSNKLMITKSLAAYNVGCLRGENLSVTVFGELITIGGLAREQRHSLEGALTAKLAALLINRLQTAFAPWLVDQSHVVLTRWLEGHPEWLDRVC